MWCDTSACVCVGAVWCVWCESSVTADVCVVLCCVNLLGGGDVVRRGQSRACLRWTVDLPLERQDGLARRSQGYDPLSCPRCLSLSTCEYSVCLQGQVSSSKHRQAQQQPLRLRVLPPHRKQEQLKMKCQRTLR